MQLKKGNIAPDFITTDVFGNEISLRKLKGKKILLSFMRNTACPFCNFRIFQLNKKAESYQAQGLEMVVFLESGKELILKSSFLKDQKLLLFSDPGKVIYKQYGVEQSALKMISTLLSAEKRKEAQESKNLGLELIDDNKATQTLIPADFLLNEDLLIEEAYYGKNLGDALAFEKIEAFLK